MICHDHKFIFIHVPKTGGTSIERMLKLEGAKHNTALQYRECVPTIFAEYFSFAFVRNPWDRVLSYYIYRRQIRQLEIEKSSTFKEWLVLYAEYVRYESHTALNDEFAPKYGVGTIVKNDPEGWRVKFDNALHMFTDNNGKIIIDFIGRFERLQQDFDSVCEELNIEPQTLPFHNETNHKPYWTYYDKECEQIVKELFQKDITYFNYTFGE